MYSTRPLILISNDDSIEAPGVHRLAECAREFGDVYVVAPRHPQSGQSAALTVNSPLRIVEKKSDFDDVRLFTVNGTPVDCIKLALHAIVPRRPDIILSGINHGSNSGINVTYSGTMGAVLEGCFEGIPSVGFSILNHSMNADFSLSLDFVKSIISKVLANGLPKGVCLNVNIPAHVAPKGVKVCRACRGRWLESYSRFVDPQGVPFYWLTGRFVNEEPESVDTDEYWLQNGYISLVPVSNDMSALESINDIERFIL